MSKLQRLKNRIRRKLNTRTFKFDSKEAVGTVTVEQGAHGLWIYLDDLVDDDPLVLIDLFYRTEDGKSIRPGAPHSVKIWSVDGRYDDPEVDVNITSNGVTYE